MDYEAQHIDAVKNLLAKLADGSQVQYGEHEIDLLNRLYEYVQDGRVGLSRRSDEAFDLICKMYPIAVNRIAWIAVRNSKLFEIRQQNDASVTYAELEDRVSKRAMEIRDALQAIGVNADQRVLVVGDDMDTTLEMTVSTLLEFLPVIAIQPQHTYVLGKGGEWCLHCSIDRELHLGLSQDAIKTGYIDIDDFVQQS
jgi:hypothetical protein